MPLHKTKRHFLLKRFIVLLPHYNSIDYVKKLATDDLPLQEYANEKWWNNKLKAMRLIEKNLYFYMQDADLQTFYNNNQAQDVGLLNRIYTEAENGNETTALVLNNALPISNENAEYRKLVNDVYLKTVTDSVYVPDSLSKLALERIANACPDKFGSVVFEARNLLIGLSKQIPEFTENCDVNAARFAIEREIENDEVTDNEYILSPNPNSGIFKIWSKNNKPMYGSIKIISILRKEITSLETKEQSSVLIDLSLLSLNPGVYFVEIIGEGNLKKNVFKTVIQ